MFSSKLRPALHVERQSLYKRLARIETILGVDLADADVLLELQLALRVRQIIGALPGGQSGRSAP